MLSEDKHMSKCSRNKQFGVSCVRTSPVNLPLRRSASASKICLLRARTQHDSASWLHPLALALHMKVYLVGMANGGSLAHELGGGVFPREHFVQVLEVVLCKHRLQNGRALADVKHPVQFVFLPRCLSPRDHTSHACSS